MPATIDGLSARVDVRPIVPLLAPLSTRARGYLARLGIRTVADLQDWNEWSLRGFRGGGRKTVQEITDAAARAGIPVAPPAREYPWQLNPACWPRR